MKRVYRVSRSLSPSDRYFLEAKSPEEAIEIVTLRLADLEGMKAWHAEPDLPKFSVPHGVVVDHEGAPIKSMEG